MLRNYPGTRLLFILNKVINPQNTVEQLSYSVYSFPACFDFFYEHSFPGRWQDISCTLLAYTFRYFYTLVISCDLIRVNVWVFKIYLKIQ